LMGPLGQLGDGCKSRLRSCPGAPDVRRWRQLPQVRGRAPPPHLSSSPCGTLGLSASTGPGATCERKFRHVPKERDFGLVYRHVPSACATLFLTHCFPRPPAASGLLPPLVDRSRHGLPLSPAPPPAPPPAPSPEFAVGAAEAVAVAEPPGAGCLSRPAGRPS
jgi:hypothetical protein